jgi:hypothetical protein
MLPTWPFSRQTVLVRRPSRDTLALDRKRHGAVTPAVSFVWSTRLENSTREASVPAAEGKATSFKPKYR